MGIKVIIRKKIRRGIYLLILVFLLFSSFYSSEAAPPFCGDGNCIGQETCTSCSADCGTCPVTPPSSASSSQTSTTTSGVATILPVKIILKNPLDEDTIKRGILTIIAEGYSGNSLSSSLDVFAESELFGKVRLVYNFENKGQGIYGANVVIAPNTTKGQYAIIVTGKKDTYDEERALVFVDPVIYINTTLKNEYLKGQRINFIGNLNYFDKKPVKNNSVKINISGLDFSFNKIISSNLSGAFSDSYLISFGEPSGIWNVKIHTIDNDGNEGSENFLIKIDTPKGVAFYTVTFLSPFKNAEFKRGTTIPITVEVKEEDKVVENATVDFKNFLGESQALVEVNPGVYTAEYSITNDDPLGSFYLTVQAVKKIKGITRAGGNNILITLKPATMKLLVLEPTATNFLVGQKIDVSVKPYYADGSVVDNAAVSMILGKEIVNLTETKSGVYTASYLFTENSGNTISFVAQDSFGNFIHLNEKRINLQSVNKIELYVRLFYYNIVVKYWYIFVVFFLLIILLTKPIWYKYYLQFRLRRIGKNEKKLLEMEIDTQLKFFKHHSMPRKNYESLMSKYRNRISELKEKRLGLKGKLNILHKNKDTNSKKSSKKVKSRKK